MKQIKIAVVPTRRGISSNRKGAFTVKDALTVKNSIWKFLHARQDGIEYIDINFLNDEGILYDDSQAETVANYLRERQVDGIFVVHCNFGCEEAVGRVCKLLKKPVFLWGPRDGAIAEDGSRSTDTQCGLFASSRILKRYGVPFSYCENCHIEDTKFEERLEVFIGAVRVVCAFSTMRVGQINARPKYFTSVMINESALLECFGVEVIPLNIAMVMEEMSIVRNQESRMLEQRILDLEERMDCHETDKEKIEASVCLAMAFERLVYTYHLSGLAIECWTLTQRMIGALPCLAIGELTDRGIPCSCETDVYGVIGSVLLHAASGGEATFFGEYTMRDTANDNRELIWHCGNAPYSLKSSSLQARFIDGRMAFPLKTGPITIVRFDCDREHFCLFSDEATAVSGVFTSGTYLWAEMDDWKKWEYKFIEGPYIHHVSVAFGRYKAILRESCKYLPGLIFDYVSP